MLDRSGTPSPDQWASVLGCASPVTGRTSAGPLPMSTIYYLSLSSFPSLWFPASGQNLLCEMHQTMTKLTFSKGWTSYPRDFKVLFVSFNYLVLLFILDGVFPIVPAIWGLFSAKGPQFSSRPLFFVAVATIMDVISYLVFVWSWNMQPAFNNSDTCPIYIF